MCDRSDHARFGRIAEGLWNFELDKSLSFQSLVSCSMGDKILERNAERMESRLVKF